MDASRIVAERALQGGLQDLVDELEIGGNNLQAHFLQALVGRLPHTATDEHIAIGDHLELGMMMATIALMTAGVLVNMNGVIAHFAQLTVENLPIGNACHEHEFCLTKVGGDFFTVVGGNSYFCEGHG